MRIYLLLLAAWGLLAACGKDDTTTVAGQVVERGSGRPVPVARVQLQATPNTGSGAYRPAGDWLDCDAQGRFAFALPETPAGHLILMAAGPLGHYTAYGEAPEVRPGKANKDLRIPTCAPAWLRFQLQDEPPRSRVYIDIGGSNTLAATLPYPRDTAFVRPIADGTNYRVTWDINEGGVRRRYTQDVNVPALDTLPVIIRF